MEIAVQVGSLSNKEIAARLFISERTVDSQVPHIFNKLGVHTRAWIAVCADDLALGSRGPQGIVIGSMTFSFFTAASRTPSTANSTAT
jgi:hypothetical protein